MSQGKKVALFMHGILDSADSYINNDEHLAPAFILANAGFDVWIGNWRGTKYSRSHQHLNLDDFEGYE
jgi:hypothetical protein